VSDDPGEMSARFVPCEVDGDLMYGGGRILRRGACLGDWDGEPIYEWWPISVDELAS